MLNAARQVSGGLGVAAFGALVAGGFEDGLRTSVVIAAVLLALTALATTRLARGGTAVPGDPVAVSPHGGGTAREPSRTRA